MNNNSNVARRVIVFALVLAIFFSFANCGSFSETSDSQIALSIGQCVRFGNYDWRVLDVVQDKALIITNQVIEDRSFDEEDNTWDKSSLRGYLNGEFYKQFSPEEKSAIFLSENDNPANTWTGAESGESTLDYVFALSIPEALKYFGDSGEFSKGPNEDCRFSDEFDVLRSATHVGGTFVSADGEVNIEEPGRVQSWWLRTTGKNQGRVSSIDYYGDIWVAGYLAFLDSIGVRPAMWVDAQYASKMVCEPNEETFSIRRGDKGDDVIHIQAQLIKFGYLTGEADGDFGKKTEAAVKKLQKANGLEETGIITNTELLILFSAAANKKREQEIVSATVTPAPSGGDKSKNQTDNNKTNYDYIGNANSKKFHYYWCSSVSSMKEKNKVLFSSRDEAINRGYKPCQRCNP